MNELPISFTDKYNLDKDSFSETGAFDVILDMDSRLFLDPALLSICKIKEFNKAKEKVEEYFSNIIKLLGFSKVISDQFWKKADKLLKFSEVTGTCFGYTKKGTSGNAIGKKLRNIILMTIKELIDAGEKDPTIFELLGVFQEGIGCDRISDLLTFILLPEILMYTQRVMEKFNLADTEIDINNIKYKTQVNTFNNRPIILLPESLLSPLPIANNYDEIDLICRENERVRKTLNEYFNLGFKEKLSKSEILKIMKLDSAFRQALIIAYKNAEVSKYDYDKDPSGEYIWYQIAKKYVQDFPLSLNIPQNADIDDVYDIVYKICDNFKDLIENNGLWKLLYDDTGKPKHERAAQLLFFGIADAYCKSNNIDLSREVNNGRGAVDFKLSRGAEEKILIEIKLTSNNQLKHGIEKQIPIYMKQDYTRKAIYLVINNGHLKALDNLMKFYNEASIIEKDKIILYTIDGSRQKSASIV